MFTDISVLVPFFKVIVFALIAYPFIRYAARMTKAFFNKRVGAHLSLIAASIVYYGGLTILGVMILHTLGLNVSALLGAAGVLGIAIGFAAQTSISNIISGVFLLLERPFSINDEIECDGIKGVVEAIDPLSVKLRTQSNQLVRIPNETLIKKSFINHTFYDARRIQVVLKIRSTSQVQHILSESVALVAQQKGVLAHPAPQAFIVQVNSLSTNIAVRCWVDTKDASRMEKQLITLFAQKYADAPERVSIG